MSDSNKSSKYEEEDLQDTHHLVKERQRFKRRPKQAADVLGQLMARKGYGQQESQDDLHQVWQESIPQAFRTKTRLSVLRGGVLEIFVESSAARQQLEFQKRNIVKKLQKKLPKNNIKDVRFKVSEINQ